MRGMGLAVLAWGVAVLAAALPGAAAPVDPPESVPYALHVIPAGEKPQRTVSAWVMEGSVFLPGDELARILGGSFSWLSELGKFTLTVGSHTVSVLDQSEFAVVDGDQVAPLPSPAFLWQGRMLVPLSIVVDDAGEARPWIEMPLHFDRESGRLQAGEVTQPTLTEVRVIQDALGWKLSLVADHPFKTQVLRAERASMVVRLKDVTYDPMTVTFPAQHPWFQGLRFRSTPSGVEVAFSAGVLPRGYRIIQSHDAKTSEILLGVDERDIRTGQLTPFAAPSGGDNVRLRTLILDPGHDSQSRGGRLAYTMCMDLARELSTSLGIEVSVTHGLDQDPAPEIRVRRANEASGDLLISLHLHDRAQGPTAYVAQPALPIPVNRELARLGFRSYYAGQEGHVQISRAVAQDLMQAVSDKLDMAPGGVYTESLPELQGALMPAVLLEIGLGDLAWDEADRQKVVDGMSLAIRNHYWRTGP